MDVCSVRPARPSLLALVAAVALTISMPVATWWLVGDQSTTTVSPDFAFRPLRIGPIAERRAGVAACTALALGLAVLSVAIVRRPVDGRWWLVLLPVLLAGAICGAGWRMMTAGVIGANIGAGLTVVVGGPVVVALVGFAGLELWSLARSPRRS